MSLIALALAATLRLDQGARAYIPASAGEKPPLLVLLHGAGGTPNSILAAFRHEAERHGVVLLAPRSRGLTWDLIAQARPRTTAAPTLDEDLTRIRAAMTALSTRRPTDPARTAIGGFSDGASTALTIGLAHPQLFGTILAYSPGMAFAPSRYDPAQRIFIAHGRSDTVLPFANTERNLVPGLQARVKVTFRPFDGEHGMTAEVQEEGVAYFAT
ncbi:phospholipase [Sphingomonas sp. ID1715]|uniref:alpha/beta hydrolase n=1 Tax=Sphingomonas sp. ID1715 TaxID=1656898 RepID=UPI001487BC85|nr:alpha/beta hydrolase-fold protein [Sphingomonas sp. ID1715]NNM78355.1 phospholipase [Sphingomonas sp. ID1715]